MRQSTSLSSTGKLMLSLFLLPGDAVCDVAGIPKDSDHRLVLRSFANMIVWSAVALGAAVWISL